jgi:hypothetical protein
MATIITCDWCEEVITPTKEYLIELVVSKIPEESSRSTYTCDVYYVPTKPPLPIGHHHFCTAACLAQHVKSNS